MIWFNSIFLLIWPMTCQGLSIISSKLMDDEPDVVPVVNHKRPLTIIRVGNQDDDDQHQPPSPGLGRADVDLAEDHMQGELQWENHNRNPILFRLNARPIIKRPGGGIILNRPLQRRPLPAVCWAGPSMFQSCCARLSEMAHDYDNIQQFCFYGKCCVNMNLTSPSSSSPAASVAPSAGGSSLAPTSSSASEGIPPASSSSPIPLTARLTSPTTDKRIRPNETKAKPSNESNALLNNNKANQKLVNSNEVDTSERETKSSDISNESPFGEPASGGKLLKMRGKDFLSREEPDEDEKKVEAPLDIEDEVSDEISSEDGLADDGAGLDDAKNSSKPLVTAQLKSVTSKPSFDDPEYENTEYSAEERGGNSAASGSSDETSQMDDKVVNDSGDVEAEPKWNANIKPYPRVHLKNRMNAANKFPKKVMAPVTSTGILSGAVTPPSNSTNKSSTVVNEDDEEVANVSIPAKNASSTVVPHTTNRASAANVSRLVTSVPPTVHLRHQVNAGVAPVKHKCPENRGGPNCSIDITGAISGYGYYVVGHTRALTRAESVKDCASRNMTLAFLTNHNEDRMLRRLVNGNATYWIGLTKHLAKGEMKSRYRWDDGSDAGTYITRYVTLDADSQKSKEDGFATTCVVKLHNGKMMVECSTAQAQQTAFPMCMYRPPNIVQPVETTSSDN